MQTKLNVYVGTYTEAIVFGTGQVLEGRGEGIYLFELEAGRAEARLLWKKSGVRNPSFLDLSPSRHFLYAVNELKDFEGGQTGAVSAFALDDRGGEPRLLNQKPSSGTDPCHVAVDGSGKFAVATNYMSGSVSVFPLLADGSLGDMCDFRQHRGSSVNASRQSGPHAHSAVFDRENRHVFVSDLGCDEVVAYGWDSGKGRLERRDAMCFKSRAGSGPRHLALHPSLPVAYIVNELDSSVSLLSWKGDGSAPRELQTISTLPTGFTGSSACADLHVSPSGDFLYASNRGHDSIAIFRIRSGSGGLEAVGHCPTGGRTPRSFDIDPSGTILAAANQDSDSVVVFRIDAERGTLEATGEELSVPTPVCVRIYDAVE
ncbi:MAG TPA: lactonase family protein [Rectinemataceae bacterium]|nr:lactonase family protein [Rectinemataceae bacterium]